MSHRNDPAGPELHRALAAYLFNLTWRLLDRAHRTPSQRDEMVHAAHASRYHWGRAGRPRNRSIAEWQISRVYAVLGRSEPARHHGRRALAIARRYRLAPFYVGYALEALARAAAVGGDRRSRDAFVRRARATAARVRAADDRRRLEADLDAIVGSTARASRRTLPRARRASESAGRRRPVRGQIRGAARRRAGRSPWRGSS